MIEKTIKFYTIEEKIPDKFDNSRCSDDLIIINTNNETIFGHYDFRDGKWYDATSWDDCYGFDEIDNVRMWAYLPVVIIN